MHISPSILSADFLNLERDIRKLEFCGADSIHIDIMDGIFVENITWGPSTVAEIRKITSLPLDVHLMVDKPERLLATYISTKANRISIHPESTVFLRSNLLKIKKFGIEAGIALKLETPVQIIENCLDIVDAVLILTCEEGFGGNAFQPLAFKKIAQVVKWRTKQNLNFKIIVDGGINRETARMCKELGVDILVAGSYIFNQDFSRAVHLLRNV